MVIGERRSFARGCGAPLFKSALEESASVWQRTGEVPNEQSLSICLAVPLVGVCGVTLALAM